ncbi:MAG TPA: TonB-dependent receptor [Pyrinomonadaceae bacterium]
MKRTMSSLVRLIACGLFLLLFLGAANAQFKAGIQGTVTDTAGGLVPEAKITLTNTETGKTQETTSSNEGFYRLSGLPPGKYKLTVEKAGYKQNVFDNVVINAEAVQGLDVALEAGEVSATVTVSQETAQTLETENANVDKAITTQEIRQLPQFGRDPYELLRLTPGVFGEGARSGTGLASNLPNNGGPGGSIRSIFQVENQVQISANGQRVTANNYQIDGTSVNSLTHGGAAVITPNQESVKEVRVIANVYSAEYGRNSGAQVLTVSQNGTNQFHGSLFLKNDSPGLNAFNKYGGLNNARPVRVNQRLNQFGGSFGGPLPIPRFGEDRGPAFKLGRDKAFFFFSYEGLRSTTSDTSNGYVVTPQYITQVQQQRPGSIAARIVGSSGFAPRVVSVIPVTCQQAGYNNSNCQQVAGGLDIGSLTGATGQYVSFGNLTGGGLDAVPDIQFAQIAVPSLTRGNQYNLRFDFILTPKDSFAISGYRSRFFGVGSDSSTGSQPMADVTTNPANSLVTLTYTRTMSATMINEARFNATRYGYNELQSSSETNFGIPRIEIETPPSAVTNKAVKFGAPYSETTPGIFAENTFEFRDTLRKVVGNHGLSFGVEIRKEQDNNNLLGGARPLFTFATLFNFANDAPLFYFLNADPKTGGPPNTQRYFRASTYAGFAQDDWKFRPNLTLNLGLRYEYFSPLSEKQGRITNLVLGPPGQELTGARLVPMNPLYQADKNNFGPRVGFAYSPKRVLGTDFSDKLVLRGGFGIAYNRIPVNDFENIRGNPPFQERITLCCGTSAQDFSTPFAGGRILYALGANNTPFSYPANPALILNFSPTTGLPTNTVPGESAIEIYGAPPKEPQPYVYTYSLEGQYSLPAKLTAELGYQGSAGRHLTRLVNQNFLYPGGNFATNILFPQTDTTASYNAMIARLTRRLSGGLQFDANYRWSKSIDIVSNEEVNSATNPTYPQDVRQERGPSDYDVRHNFVVSALYDLPFLRHRQDFLGQVFGGWQITTIATYHTGFPWTPVIFNCPSTVLPTTCPARPTAYFGGAGTDSSNEAFINGSNFPLRGLDPLPGKNYFSTTGATIATTLPGVGRNSFRGPRYRDVDVSLVKRIGLEPLLREGAGLEIRANFFNVFNLLNLQPFGFASSSTNILDPNFGRSRGGLAGRVVEFQGRFNF